MKQLKYMLSIAIILASFSFVNAQTGTYSGTVSNIVMAGSSQSSQSGSFTVSGSGSSYTLSGSFMVGSNRDKQFNVEATISVDSNGDFSLAGYSSSGCYVVIIYGIPLLYTPTALSGNVSGNTLTFDSSNYIPPFFSATYSFTGTK